MHSIVTLARWEAVILFGGIFGVVFWKLASGAIPLDGLLDADVRDKNSPDGSGLSTVPSGGRAQILLVILSVAVWYLLQVIHNPRQFPQIPDSMLRALAGSSVLYLGGKTQALFFGRLRDLIR